MQCILDSSALTTACRLASEAIETDDLPRVAFNGECLHLLLRTLAAQNVHRLPTGLANADAAALAIYTSSSITAAHQAAQRCRSFLDATRAEWKNTATHPTNTSNQ